MSIRALVEEGGRVAIIPEFQTPRTWKLLSLINGWRLRFFNTHCSKKQRGPNSFLPGLFTSNQTSQSVTSILGGYFSSNRQEIKCTNSREIKHHCNLTT